MLNAGALPPGSRIPYCAPIKFGLELMSRFWSPVVHTLSPYVPGEQTKQDGIVKLNTNENPYPPSPRVLAAIASAAERLRLYPDPRATRARGHRGPLRCGARASVRRQRLRRGAGPHLPGTSEARTTASIPRVTYSFYPVYCGLYGITHDEVPLDAAMRIDISNYRRPSSAILLCNANAPTGIALQRDAIAWLLAEQPDRLVVVDEAYVDFGAESAVPLVARHDNLLVIQTFSKSRSLAGLRVGFAIGQRPLIEALERVKDSFNSYPLDCLAIAGAVAAIEDDGWFRDTRARIIASREILARDLRQLGFEVLPSLANFVFARHRSRSGADLAAALRQRGVLVRHFRKPRIEDFLRITVGTEAECARLVEVLRGLI